ncbi:hypothetical protein BFJ72_g8236 [Fusarium proliferatum]|uniref:MARVEL domain-containing protein n=1 Tax=Gibberella intermedia TaxID=948311 RepID=A0A365MWC9_GIBIN|nr:hypothetical protein FPRO05_04138 [Fusarium proliferatum]RKL36687.1 hypothetical protein BFJ72_g8236 [Fusarium proliferatum]
MGIRDFFDSRFFEHSWKNKVFILQVVTVTIAFILGIAKVATKPSGIPMTRSDIMAITMVSYLRSLTNTTWTKLTVSQSLKTYAFLAYEYVTQKVDKFKRFGSLKANAILNTMDIVFWAVVMGLAFNMATQVCIGANCAIGILVGLVALVVTIVNFWAAVIAWKDHKYFKCNGVRRGHGEK